MKSKHYLFHLGHPAHFQLFRYTIKALSAEGHRITIAIKKKDILESLLQHDGLEYINFLPDGRNNSKLGILAGMIKSDLGLLRYCLKHRPDLMIGTSYAISHVGKLLAIPSVNVNEDDWDAVPFYSRFSYPWASVILAPESCNTGKWSYKTVKYSGNHELAYLHPNRFHPDPNLASKYVDISKPYFIIRFASFKAHHDKGVEGLTNETANTLFNFLQKRGKIYITSERELPPDFEPYRLMLNPLDIHHVMAYSSIFIGDSQTMAAEAGVLGIPFIRVNDFVNRLGYLNELEQKYNLGYGLKPDEQHRVIDIVEEWLSNENLKVSWVEKRNRFLDDKIDVTAFLTWFITNYPENMDTIKSDPDYQLIFK